MIFDPYLITGARRSSGTLIPAAGIWSPTLATFAPHRHQSATRRRHVLLSAVGPHLHSRVLTRYAPSRLLGCRCIDHPRDLLAVLARRVADATDRRERAVAASLLD